MLEASDTLVSWKTGVVFKPRPNGSLYAAYGSSSTPPGSGFVLSTTSTNQNNPNLAAQEARNIEVGTKWDFFDSRLSTRLALYRSENLNVVSTDAVTGLVTQDISQTVEGLELGISGRITSHWLVFGGVGLIDSENNSAGTTSAANDGAELRFTPKVSGSLWTTYILPNNLTLGAGVQHSSSVVRSTANGITSTSPSLASVPSYTTFNLMADYAVNDCLSLRLNVDNLTDADYFRLNNNGGRYYPGAPRSFLLTANLKF
jgi:catecholate siderophore receptor